MDSVVIFASIDFRKHAQALTTHKLCSHTHKLSHRSLLCEAFTAPEPPTPTHHDHDLAGTGTAPIEVDHDRDRRFARSRSRRSASIAIIEISEIAIAISPIEIAPIAIEIAPIAIAISPRIQFVLLGFLTEKLICPSGFYLSF